MTKRYEDKEILVNQEDTYSEVLESRGVTKIRQYGSPNMTHPTREEIRHLQRVGHVWKVGDRFYKLAHRYYGDAKYWWVIAWWNSYPTEATVRKGTVLYVPINLEDALNILGA